MSAAGGLGTPAGLRGPRSTNVEPLAGVHGMSSLDAAALGGAAAAVSRQSPTNQGRSAGSGARGVFGAVSGAVRVNSGPGPSTSGGSAGPGRSVAAHGGGSPAVTPVVNSYAPPARASGDSSTAIPIESTTIPVEPMDICYGTRVGIRACSRQRYVAAFPRGAGIAPSEGFELEVSGFHPFRQSDVTDRALECPSEWVVLHYSHRQFRGPIRLGDEVCFAKEIAGIGERRKDRFTYLSLGPTADGDEMEPLADRREGSDLCKWILVMADDPDNTSKLRTSVEIMMRGKYGECLSIGQPLWKGPPPKSFRSPARISGWKLACRGREGRSPDLRFRIVKAGLPFGRDSESEFDFSVARPPPLPQEDLVNDLQEGFTDRSISEQEQLLMDDVLYCLLGADGNYIRKVVDRPAPSSSSAAGPRLTASKFVLDMPEGADTSTVQFLRQVLPLCEHHAFVQNFVELQGHTEFGTVNHALCASIGELLREFAVKVGQLESALRTNELSIAKLWYHLQPSLDTMVSLRGICTHVYGRVGGLVLNGIEEVLSRSSITTTQDLCEFLLQQSSRPYFQMVSRWIYEGRLDDPYGEFFISESARQREERFGGPAADFWQKHFLLEERSVPQFLSQGKDKILNAGKYLHVFFSAAPDRELPEPEDRGLLRYSRRRRDCEEAVDAAYRRASAALLGLFMAPAPEGLDLPGRLRSMRSFFFMAKGDWFGQFMDTACAELERPAAEVPLTRLEGLLDLAMRASSAASDIYREDISCGMHSFRVEDACNRMVPGHSLNDDQMEDEASSIAKIAAAAGGASTSTTAPVAGFAATGVANDTSGVRCFTLKYRTAWPLSIVFSRALLLKYQVIFRHLLFCRYVERKLVEVWVDHQYTKELGLDNDFSPSYSLRQRMLHFCRDYIYYATVEVLEPQSHRFLTSLSTADTVDEVLKRHDLFLGGCLRELLLTEREALYRGLSKVLQTCLAFAYNLHRFSHDLTGDTKEDASDVAAEDFDESPPLGSGSARNSAAERRMAKVTRSTSNYVRILSQKSYSNMIRKFKGVFESQLQSFLRQISQETSSRFEHFLSNMQTRLDYNDYYATIMTAGA